MTDLQNIRKIDKRNNKRSFKAFKIVKYFMRAMVIVEKN